MAAPPRNAPCPCNSGKKHKRCCGRAQAAIPAGIDLQRHAAFALEDRLIQAMDQFASRRFGRHWFDGIIEYLGLARSPEESDSAYLVPWSYFLLPVAGRRVAEWYLEDHGGRLRDDERAFLLAQLDTWPTLWEAQEIRPGAGVELRDLLTGATVFVNDHSASETLKRYHVILARIVRLGDIAILGGAHPQPLPPIEAQRVVEIARRLHGVRTRPLPVASLRSYERAAALYRLWDETVRDLYARPRVPALANTDGEPLLLTTDYFQIGAGQQGRVRATIAAMEGADPITDGPDGDEFVLSKPGNAKFAALPNTTLARLELSRRELIVETNSLERANRIRAAVERACGDSIRHRIRKHTDPATLLRNQGPPPRRDRRGKDAPEPENHIPPEIRAQLVLEFKQKHYAAWVDEEIPALAGKTPREAVKAPGGRARLEALLKEMELREARLPEAERYDVNQIRRALGLEVLPR